jgi:hypothetical protein
MYSILIPVVAGVFALLVVGMKHIYKHRLLLAGTNSYHNSFFFRVIHIFSSTEEKQSRKEI